MSELWTAANNPWTTAKRLAATTPERVPWRIEGFVANGLITEVVGAIKGGKSTFIAHMARAIVKSGSFLGRQVETDGLVWVTEERQVSFRRLLERADLLDCDDLHILFREKVAGVSWQAVVDLAVKRALDCTEHCTIVFDTFSKLAGIVDENDAAAAVAMAPLEVATAKGIAVILGRHARKAGGSPADAGRGNSSISGVTDVILQLSKPGATHPATVRRLNSEGRFEETPDELLIDLRDGEYHVLGDVASVAYERAKSTIVEALGAGEQLQVDLFALDGVGKGTAQRVLTDLQASHKAERLGTPRSRSDPTRWRLLAHSPTRPDSVGVPESAGATSESPTLSTVGGRDNSGETDGRNGKSPTLVRLKTIEGVGWYIYDATNGRDVTNGRGEDPCPFITEEGARAWLSKYSDRYRLAPT